MTGLAQLIADSEAADRLREDQVQHVAEALAVLYEAITDRPGDWAELAACKGQVSVMFPVRGQPTEPARALCRRCPVLDECRIWSLGVPGQAGVCADTTEAERRALRTSAA